MIAYKRLIEMHDGSQKNASLPVEMKIHKYVMCKHETSCLELFVNLNLKKFLYSNFSEY